MPIARLTGGEKVNGEWHVSANPLAVDTCENCNKPIMLIEWAREYVWFHDVYIPNLGFEDDCHHIATPASQKGKASELLNNIARSLYV